jgi:hypothetical protein
MGPETRHVLAGCLLLGACTSNGDGGGDSNPTWSCFEGVDSCDCERLRPGWESASSGRSGNGCAGFGCCLYSEATTESTLATCQCNESEVACETQAAAMRDTTVVAECPPGGAVGPTACAQASESCELSYLGDRSLGGCCPGTLCDLGPDGIRLCRAGTAEEEASARECQRAAYSGADTLEVSAGSINTSVGSFDFSVLERGESFVGTGGCVTSVSLRLQAPGPCTMDLAATLVNGRFQVTSVDASLASCGGYSGAALGGSVLASDPAQIPFTLTWEAVSCDWGGGFEGFCTAGSMDWHLDGTIGDVTFQDSHVVLRGVLCVSQPSGACPPA